MSRDLPHDEALPPVDARLIAPEQRYEIQDGRLVYVPPADEPHGAAHAHVAAILMAYRATDYAVAVDMLTRTSETTDIAPDVSVYPAERDPVTGGRRLEELAFEVVSTTGLADAAVRARRLRDRGVRRVFAIDVRRQRLLEWSDDVGSWQLTTSQATIADRALIAPLPIAALVSAADADGAVAAALLARGAQPLEAALAARFDRGRSEGKAEGKAEALLAVLAARGVALTDDVAARVRAERAEARLDAWLSAAGSAADASFLEE